MTQQFTNRKLYPNVWESNCESTLHFHSILFFFKAKILDTSKMHNKDLSASLKINPYSHFLDSKVTIKQQ